MSAVVESQRIHAPQPRLPLLAEADFARAFAWRDGREIGAAEFLADTLALAERLPQARYALNLCARRYEFLVAFCAAIVAGQTNLLPAARAPRVIADLLRAYPDAVALGEDGTAIDGARASIDVPAALAGAADSGLFCNVTIPADQLVAIGFTSGTTGAPKPHGKTWGSLCASTARNADALRALVGEAPQILATVPPQHMYGIEMSVLLPLRTRGAIHAAQPLLPADVAAALAQMPAPRLLVTTPFHLRALLDSGVAPPPLAAIVTATAPLPGELAAAAEARWATTVFEVLGSTETCVIARRRAALDEPWSLYEGVSLHPQPDGTQVCAPWFAEPALLQDVVELLPDARFRLRGRSGDLLEIAGKRASLADLTRRLNAIPGVRDGVFFQLDADGNGVRRLAALAQAPGLSRAQILAALREAIDPVFLPRPLHLIEALPRNAAGKLPREALLAALQART